MPRAKMLSATTVLEQLPDIINGMELPSLYQNQMGVNTAFNRINKSARYLHAVKIPSLLSRGDMNSKHLEDLCMYWGMYHGVYNVVSTDVLSWTRNLFGTLFRKCHVPAKYGLRGSDIVVPDFWCLYGSLERKMTHAEDLSIPCVNRIGSDGSMRRFIQKLKYSTAPRKIYTSYRTSIIDPYLVSDPVVFYDLPVMSRDVMEAVVNEYMQFYTWINDRKFDVDVTNREQGAAATHLASVISLRTNLQMLSEAINRLALSTLEASQASALLKLVGTGESEPMPRKILDMFEEQDAPEPGKVLGFFVGDSPVKLWIGANPKYRVKANHLDFGNDDVQDLCKYVVAPPVTMTSIY